MRQPEPWPELEPERHSEGPLALAGETVPPRLRGPTRPYPRHYQLAQASVPRRTQSLTQNTDSITECQDTFLVRSCFIFSPIVEQ